MSTNSVMIILECKILGDYSANSLRINGKPLKETKLDVYFRSASKDDFTLTKNLNIKAKLPGANIATYGHGFVVKKGLLPLTLGEN